MKQTEIIAQLRSLRESQADFARTNGDEIFKRGVEALDAAIEALERIRWRRVGDETPEMGPYDSNVNVLTFNMADDGRLSYISTTGYYHNRPNPWCDAPGVHTVDWAYLPEMPEEWRKDND